MNRGTGAGGGSTGGGGGGPGRGLAPGAVRCWRRGPGTLKTFLNPYTLPCAQQHSELSTRAQHSTLYARQPNQSQRWLVGMVSVLALVGLVEQNHRLTQAEPPHYLEQEGDTLKHRLTHSLSPTHSLSLYLSHTLSVFLSQTHTHSLSHTHSPSHYLSHTYYLSDSHSHTVSGAGAGAGGAGGHSLQAEASSTSILNDV